ncbi:HAD superfamily hydrolase (TIGR01450 family) [Haloactinopolyspora alba]|uniref:HAD superfamily hydrolase (TIGR01450 family) n=1 Tax=Haloactinopolyspora alba TaxID=648780 RepID=A0A2P8E231_9ACTN|nr:HAD-IIA family hydrolase [Haloactinopolyspora alba]PSL03526.1 HAD superfamily hydrolase (TIGR01450 family) [Haloactinopolyspora alba]
MFALTRTYDVALLDLDGVVYVGERAVPHAAEALVAARDDGMRLAFVTNNASRPAETVAAHLSDIGVAAAPEEVVTSAQAAARVLAERLSAGARVLVVGGEGLEVALRERGLEPVGSADDGPEAVAQGFSPDIGWRALAEGTYAVASGALWVATNVDATIPTTRGRAPGNGTLVSAVGRASGREPVVAGKPEPPMHREAILRTGARRPLVVGDRLDTDIEGAERAGVDSLLVLTGVTDPVELVLSPAGLRPTYLGADLRALHEPPDRLVVEPGRSSHGPWKAAVEGGRLRLWRDEPAAGTSAPELDAVRAACGAAWAADGVEPASVRDAFAAANWAVA